MRIRYDVSRVKPLNIGVITAPNCQTFYGVYENDKQPERLDSAEFSAPGTAEIVYVRAFHSYGRRLRRHRFAQTRSRLLFSTDGCVAFSIRPLSAGTP